MSNNPLLFNAQGGVATPESVHELTPKGAIVLSHFHIIAQKFGWSIRCEKCGSTIQGFNTGNDKYVSVRCKCSEWRCESKDLAGRI